MLLLVMTMHLGPFHRSSLSPLDRNRWNVHFPPAKTHQLLDSRPFPSLAVNKCPSVKKWRNPTINSFALLLEAGIYNYWLMIVQYFTLLCLTLHVVLLGDDTKGHIFPPLADRKEERRS